MAVPLHLQSKASLGGCQRGIRKCGLPGVFAFDTSVHTLVRYNRVSPPQSFATSKPIRQDVNLLSNGQALEELLVLLNNTPTSSLREWCTFFR
jgi:hypothetical protein